MLGCSKVALREVKSVKSRAALDHRRTENHFLYQPLHHCQAEIGLLTLEVNRTLLSLTLEQQDLYLLRQIIFSGRLQSNGSRGIAVVTEMSLFASGMKEVILSLQEGGQNMIYII
jgi:hypothetical protein